MEAVTASEAARRLGVSFESFQKIAATGEIRRVQYPGMKPKFLAEDIQRLIDTCVEASPSGPRKRSQEP